ncbi:Palmitoyl-monogalactosyldiacylglycerol delta-7 desaturase, chloroplastic [Linum perenne]
MHEHQIKPNTTMKAMAKPRRKLTPWDISAISTIGATHLLALYAPFCFSWSLFFMAYVIMFITGCWGICLSYHRNLSHKSFKITPKWLEYLFAYCGVHALQGDPLTWVSNHRFHHRHTDTERDPHSAVLGFWHSHMGWIFDSALVKEKCGKRNNVEDLKSQAFYRWLRNTYVLHPLGLAILLYALGGFPYIVWGMGVRVVASHHFTWLVNSASHIWGTRSWNTNDLSKNNWWVGILAYGEGWHNNHHAFQYSARQGLEWWQIDITWYIVKFLEANGLAYDVKLPNHMHMQKLAIKST